MIKNIGLKSEHPDIPESYTITVNTINGKVRVLKCASHFYIDKVWKHDNGAQVCVGVHPNPFYEIWTTDNKMQVIVTSAVESIEFDDNWSKIVSIRKKMIEATDDSNK